MATLPTQTLGYNHKLPYKYQSTHVTLVSSTKYKAQLITNHKSKLSLFTHLLISEGSFEVTVSPKQQ
jgi:hypothetical protein